MKYSSLVEYYERLESTQSTLEKTDILSELFSRNDNEVGNLVLLVSGKLFPAWQDKDLGLSSKTLVKIISRATGKSEEKIESSWKEQGDLGDAAREVSQNKTQTRLATRDLEVSDIIDTTEQIAEMEENSLESVDMDKKIGTAAELVSAADPDESKYVVRTLLQNMRLGVAEGLIRDAISEAFLDGENASKVQHAYNLTNDFRQVSEAAKEGVSSLEELSMEVFRPVNSMLAKKVESIEEGFEEVGEPASVDYKYDGIRAQIHKKNGKVKVYTRRLDDITEQFPDVVESFQGNVDDNTIIDTEIVGYNKDTGDTVPFQELSQRVKRKYEIDRMKKEIPVEVRPFDIIFKDGSLMEKSLEQRFEILKKSISEAEDDIRLVDNIRTESREKVAEFDNRATSEGHEGIMMKALDAKYKPGKRVGYMVKLKPVMETLDLAVIGAKWSEGRRSGWLGRLKLGCYNESKGSYEMIGRMATGLTDEQLEEITNKLEPLIVDESGREVNVKPEIIVEVEYEEIQDSPNYESNYALRFPRMKSFREDKKEADTLSKVERLYNNQS